VYVKEKHPQYLVQVFLDLFHSMWENGLDVSKPELLSQVLSERFNKTEVKDILENANSAPHKQRLNDNTKEALDHGAFGCPWFFVRNSSGLEEPFFGSDRCVHPTPASSLSGYETRHFMGIRSTFRFRASRRRRDVGET
jgi:glutathione S-transferase kappa 1